MTPVEQFYCQTLNISTAKQLPESRSSPAAPREPAHKSVVVKVVLRYAILVGSFRSRAATSASLSVGSVGFILTCCRRKHGQKGWGQSKGQGLLSFPGELLRGAE